MNSDEKSRKRQQVKQIAHKKALLTGYRSTSLPVNMIPFLHAMADMVRSGEHLNKDVVGCDDYKRLLWVVLADAYGGTMEVVDLYEEYTRLADLDDREVAA